MIMKNSHDSIIIARRAYFLYDNVRYINQHLGAGQCTELIVEFDLADGYDGPMPVVTACQTDIDTGTHWEENCEMQPDGNGGVIAIIGLWQPDDKPGSGEVVTMTCEGKEVARIKFNSSAVSIRGEINFAK